MVRCEPVCNRYVTLLAFELRPAHTRRQQAWEETPQLLGELSLTCVGYRLGHTYGFPV